MLRHITKAMTILIMATVIVHYAVYQEIAVAEIIAVWI